MSFLFKNYSLEEVVYLLIRWNKTKIFLWNTNKSDRNGLNKQNTQTKHLEKDNTGKKGEGVVPTMHASEFLFFDSTKEARNDFNTFSNWRFIKKQKPTAFWKKYYMLTCSKLRRFHWMYLTLVENST